MFIGGLASHTTSESLKRYFERFGEVQDSILMVDRVSGRSRCFGFITMLDPKDIESILAQEHTLDGKKIDCKKAVPREHNPNVASAPFYRTKKMFVGGLPPDITDEDFKYFFSQFGEVEDSIVIQDKETKKPRGFGFVTFVSEDTTELVLENYEKNAINGKWVECKKATPKQTQNVFQGYQNYPVYTSFPQMYFQGYQMPDNIYY